ncbi:MAG: hypothetical protein CYPHOPRED_004489 [Cyphobasidiales sp. Tagirdzhanova-0007]|nr:MAG: hypothetical protein CYPHOPRED_004489 [Cyphobasidiales sp. Tagirdzhanova-0007]
MAEAVPKQMKALYYSEPRKFSVTTRPTPVLGDEECLIKGVPAIFFLHVVSAVPMPMSMKGNLFPVSAPLPRQNLRIQRTLSAEFPLIPGHEVVGPIVAIGKNVKSHKIGDRVVADVGETCGQCYHCIRGTSLYCEKFEIHGVSMHGGFAEYASFHHAKLFKIENLTDLEATLLEPASCAVHGLDKLQLKLGSECLLIGAGPTGLILSQLLKLNGASRVVLAANRGKKMTIARSINAADEYLELDRQAPAEQWAQLKKDNPYGFDVVIEATGVESLADNAINYVKRGGTLMIYGVYNDAARVHWPPNKIFLDEIRVIGSFSQTHCFPRAVAYLDSKKVNVTGMVTDVYPLTKYQECLDKMASRDAMKIAISDKHAKQ